MRLQYKTWAGLLAVLLLCSGSGLANPVALERILERPAFDSLSPKQKHVVRHQLKPGMEVRRYLADGLSDFEEGSDTSCAIALLRLQLLMEQFNVGGDSADEEVYGTHQRKSAAATMEGCFFFADPFFRAVWSLAVCRND